MPDDLRALLAAIVADPADDTARLVYADCLQERGNSVRADFIRLQVEAERLHPDSNARARFQEKALALFAEHWIEWWGEVCAAVGLPGPTPNPRGPIGRFARRVGITNLPGYPYERMQFAARAVQPRSGMPYRSDCAGWLETVFRRGFPDSVKLSLPYPEHEEHYLRS